MEILKFLLIIVEVLVLFNLLIIVHELGHFLAARWRGLAVDRFGVWFGKPIWEKEFRGVKYCLGWIPAGGFVSLPQMAPMEAIEGKNESSENLPPISALDKIIVAFAGPLFSFLLALAFAVIVWGVGRPVSESDRTTTIGYVAKESPAEKAGLKAGDKILAIDNHPVTRWSGIGDSIKWRIISSEEEKITLTVLRDGQTKTFEATPKKEATKFWERKGLREIQIEPAQTCIVAYVASNSPAMLAGIQTNDIVQKINGLPVFSPSAVLDAAERSGFAPITIELKRGVQMLTKTVKPELPISPPGETKPRLGLGWDVQLYLDNPGPLEQIRDSFNSMVNTFTALFSAKSDVKPQHLSGPVGIMRIYYMLFQSDYGWQLAIWFSVIFNVNLALLNLLPIPVLDGGHIVLAIIEGIRRKTVSVRILQHVQTGCALVIISYMLYLTFYDITGMAGKHEKARGPLQFAPKASQSGR
ncbi:MAG: RIP metalloprotease RseP [Verrucomicrobiota bacterium]